MFGYVTINRPELKVKELEIYEAYYCGLCRVLREKYGVTGMQGLSYDMTFLSMLLASLYEEQPSVSDIRCMFHPGKKKKAVITETMKYTADVNFMLAYYCCIDNWEDEHSIRSLNKYYLMRKKYKKISAEHKQLHQAMQDYLKKLHKCEKNSSSDIEEGANLTGELMAQIYSYKDDVWKKTLSDMGYYIGKFIYLMDAYDDVEKDIKKNNYNPFKEMYMSCGDFDSRCMEYMQLLMSRCCRAFETLPVIENSEILRNILYAGVWVKYSETAHNRKMKAEGKKNDRSV